MSDAKLIFENWRGFLNERKSDALYKAIVDFFVDVLWKPKNFRVSYVPAGEPIKHWSRDDKDWWQAFHTGEPLRAPGSENEKHAAMYGDVIADEEYLYKRYLEILADNNVTDDPIFSDWSKGGNPYRAPAHPDFVYAINKFRFRAVYRDPTGNSGGSMSDNGRMTLFHYGRIDGVDDNEAFLRLKEKFRSTLDHEIVHYINSVRSGFVRTRSVGGEKQYDTGSQEYVDSTEEMQARLIEAFKRFERLPDVPERRWTTKEEGGWWKTFKNWIGMGYDPYDLSKDKDRDGLADHPSLKRKGKERWYLTLYTGSIRWFIKQWIEVFYAEGIERYYLENHTKENQQRLLGRVYQYAKDLKDSRNYKKWVEQEERMRASIDKAFKTNKET